MTANDETHERVAEAIRAEYERTGLIQNLAAAAIAAYEAAPEVAAMLDFWKRVKEGTQRGREDVAAGRVTPLPRPTEPDPGTLERMGRWLAEHDGETYSWDSGKRGETDGGVVCDYTALALEFWRAEHGVADD